MSTSINTQEIPESVVASATAASYTIPTNYYGIVKAQVKGGGYLTIAGAIVLGSDSWGVLSNNVSPRTMAVTANDGFTNRTSAKGLAPIQMLTASPNNVAGTDSSFRQISAAGTLVNTSPSVSDLGDTFTNASAQTNMAAQFKLPAGTTVVGTGDARYLIELYRIKGT